MVQGVRSKHPRFDGGNGGTQGPSGGAFGARQWCVAGFVGLRLPGGVPFTGDFYVPLGGQHVTAAIRAIWAQQLADGKAEEDIPLPLRKVRAEILPRDTPYSVCCYAAWVHQGQQLGVVSMGLGDILNNSTVAVSLLPPPEKPLEPKDYLILDAPGISAPPLTGGKKQDSTSLVCLTQSPFYSAFSLCTEKGPSGRFGDNGMFCNQLEGA
jgi:rhodanese-related sulfurtransferase